MHKVMVTVFGLLCCLPVFALDALDDSLAGAWLTQVTDWTPNQQVLLFNQKDGLWTGSMTTRFGTLQLKDIVFKNGRLAFSEVFDLGIGPVSPVRVDAVLRAGTLYLNMPSPTGGFRTRVAHRANSRDVSAIEAATPKSLVRAPLPDNSLARTPPMGWNSWNFFGGRIDDKTVRQIADAMVKSGLRDVGYNYVNVDDSWQGNRDANGALHPNARFPDMKALGDYIHSRGLKFGIYSGPGTRTCTGHEGSYGHEEQDAKTFAEWGVDYLKYDWCSADFMHATPAEMQAAYYKMGAALQASGRPILYALCQYGLFDVGKWGRKVGANVWRTTYDISDSWAKMEEIGLNQSDRYGDAAPGGWNDPDMLEVGNGGMTLEEYRTHMTLWSMLSAPLLLGNDLRSMPPEIKELLTNTEVLAIDQDALGMEARPLRDSTEVWTKPLADGSVAVALLNRSASPAQKQVLWDDIGLADIAVVRDLWQQTDLSPQPDGYRAMLQPHGAVLLRVATKAAPSSAHAEVDSRNNTVNIVFIGDSITQGAGLPAPEQQAAPTLSVNWLRANNPGMRVFSANLGKAGHTTVDTLPATHEDFAEIEQAAASLEGAYGGRLVFSIMLGTNDSAMNGPLGSPVSPGDYRKNLTTIIDRLLQEHPGCTIVLNRPLWYSPNTYNSARYLAEGLQRLQSYFPEIDALVAQYAATHPGQVLRGDTKAYDFFREQHLTYLLPEEGQRGTFYLHPNAVGAEVLGNLWGVALEGALKDSMPRTAKR